MNSRCLLENDCHGPALMMRFIVSVLCSHSLSTCIGIRSASLQLPPCCTSAFELDRFSCSFRCEASRDIFNRVRFFVRLRFRLFSNMLVLVVVAGLWLCTTVLVSRLILTATYGMPLPSTRDFQRRVTGTCTHTSHSNVTLGICLFILDTLRLRAFPDTSSINTCFHPHFTTSIRSRKTTRFVMVALCLLVCKWSGWIGASEEILVVSVARRTV